MKTPLITCIVLCIILVSGYVVGMEQTVLPASSIADLEWSSLGKLAAVIFFPGLVAMTLDVVTTTVKRKSSVRKMQPMYEWDIYMFSLGVGAILGPVCQVGLQKVMSFLFNIPIFWELVPLSIIITGPASLVWYEVLRHLAVRFKMHRMYAWLSVKTIDPSTGEIDHKEGDVTRLAALLAKAKQEDPTDRRAGS